MKQNALNFLVANGLRGFGLFLGLFTALNCAGESWRRDFDANIWWVSVPPLSDTAERGFLFISALALLGYALRPGMGRGRRLFTATFSALLCLATLFNGIQFYSLMASGGIQAGVPLPFSFLLSALLGLLAQQVLTKKPLFRETRSRAVVGLSFLFCLVGFPIAQMLFFGKTDYSRPAQAAVVFGARAYADGSPSDALADRVRTGCELYRSGLVSKLIFSGGPGDGATHETEAMRRMAIRLGVLDADILLDSAGLNTEATVDSLARLMSVHGFKEIIAVSHFYHLPRVKLACRRAHFEVRTMPAREARLLARLPVYMAREAVALWVYYLRPLARS